MSFYIADEVQSMHRVGYHKLISNKREWNNCFIIYKYQTLDKNILNFIF